MDQYKAAKAITNQKLKALEADILNLRQTSQVSTQRHSLLLKRQHDLTLQHGESHAQPSDIIKLNIGGKKMRVLRETLTLVKGSRLEVLFSGRWKSKLLRDNEGSVFLDLDPCYFTKIMEYLYMIKVQKTKGNNVNDNNVKLPGLPKMANDYEQKVMDLYIAFFCLGKNKQGHPNVTNASTSAEASSTDQNNTSSYDDLLNAFKKEQQALTQADKSLDDMEEKLVAEEDFVSFFTHTHSNRACTAPHDDTNDDDISFTSMSSDLDSDTSSVECDKEDDGNADTMKQSTILKLWIDGEIIPVKRSTMCICKGSHLADSFNDAEWMKKHSFTFDDGMEVILIEHSALIFKTIINQLRLRAMMRSVDGAEMPLVKMDNDEDMTLLKSAVSTLFEGEEECILGEDDKCTSMDSTILASKSEGNHIKTWLGEVNRQSESELLYRGSRDGWNISDFHGKCDGKGATVTIVKTSDGYVFGGYSDQSWTGVHDNYISSNEAFLFSLKCHGGLEPTKMKIKSGQNHNAVYARSSKGPTFGGGHDLCIGPRNGTLKEGYTKLNYSYELPTGASNTSLTGKHGRNNKFGVAEVEVFKV
jgi:hypothetical protein